MSRYVLLRLLDSFFRRWWLFLIPVVALGAVGAVSAVGTKSVYLSAGTMNVPAQTVLSDLTSTEVNFGYRTPADVTASDVNQLLRTGEFVKAIASSAGLSTAVSSGVLTLPQITKAVNVTTSGDNLVRFSAQFDNPEVAFRLAQATIDSYVQTKIDTAVSQSDVAIDVYNGLVANYQTSVNDASTALDTWVEDNPTQLDGTYTAAKNVELTRLQAAVTAAQTKLDTAQSSLDVATLNKAQSQTSINQQFQVVDQPETPVGREPKVKKAAISFGAFLIIGLLLSLGAVVISAALDRTIRYPSDAAQRLGVPAIATIPRARRR